MAAYSRVSQPFTLPKGFDPTGTDIRKCIDPEMGYFEPKDDVVYTFLIVKLHVPAGHKTYSICHKTAKEMESLREVFTKVLFVSPRLDEPEHEIDHDKLNLYAIAMAKKWTESRHTTETSSKPSPMFPGPLMGHYCYRGIQVICHPTEKDVYLMIEGNLKNVALSRVNGELKVVGYKNPGTKLPHQVFKELYVKYDMKIDDNVIEDISTEPPTFQDEIFGSVSMITGGLMEGVVVECHNEDGRQYFEVLGMGPRFARLERDLAAEIIATYVVGGHVKLPKRLIKKPKLALEDFLIGTYRIVGGPLDRVVVRKGKDYYYADRSGLTARQIKKINKHYPQIAILY